MDNYHNFISKTLTEINFSDNHDEEIYGKWIKRNRIKTIDEYQGDTIPYKHPIRSLTVIYKTVEHPINNKLATHIWQGIYGELLDINRFNICLRIILQPGQSYNHIYCNTKAMFEELDGGQAQFLVELNDDKTKSKLRNRGYYTYEKGEVAQIINDTSKVVKLKLLLSTK